MIINAPTTLRKASDGKSTRKVRSAFQNLLLFMHEVTYKLGDNLAVWIIDLHTEGFLDGGLKTTLAAKGIP